MLQRALCVNDALRRQARHFPLSECQVASLRHTDSRAHTLHVHTYICMYVRFLCLPCLRRLVGSISTNSLWKCQCLYLCYCYTIHTYVCMYVCLFVCVSLRICLRTCAGQVARFGEVFDDKSRCIRDEHAQLEGHLAQCTRVHSDVERHGHLCGAALRTSLKRSSRFNAASDW
jgi:hypothetical protein